jgi:hypothetical protein
MGAESIGFFLRDTDEDHRIAHRSLSPQLMSAPVFGFVALKVKQWDALLFGESLDFGDEFSRDVAQKRRRSDRLATLLAEEPDQSSPML